MEEMNQTPNTEKSLKGYKMIVLLLAIILGGLSFMYYKQVRDIQAEYKIEKDTLTNRLSALMGEYDSIRTENDTMSVSLVEQRQRADSLMQRLAKERSFSRSKIKEYEKELGTLRTVMRNFVKQLDSLNTLNIKLTTENIAIREQISNERLRAEKAEEKADELDVKVRQGSVLKARDINLIALNNNDKNVSRASRAARLRVDFVVSANALARPGEIDLYVRITGPDGYILTNNANATFNFEGDRISYSATRQVDYQNSDLPVSIFYNGSGIVAGKYKVAIYAEGHLIGSNEVIMR